MATTMSRLNGTGASCAVVLLFLALVAMVALGQEQRGEVPPEERNALLDLYEGTGGAKWKRNDGWNTQNSTCTWYGITCDSTAVNGTNSTNVVEINLEGNGLAGKIPTSIGQLSKLQALFLSDNELTSLPDTIGELLFLEELEIDNNNLTKLPDGVGSAIRLQSLIVDSNQLKSLPVSLGSLDALMYLSAKQNRLTGIPETSFSGLENLVLLDLSENKLTAFPEIAGNTRLVELRLNNNDIKGRVNDDVGDLHQLEILALENNKITMLPDSIAELQSLKTLTVQNNRLMSLPMAIGSLDALTHLDASSNQLIEVPLSFSGLQSLLFLSLSNNEFESFPAILTANDTLRTFYCSKCGLDGFRFQTLLFNLTSLEDLDLSDNEMIGTIPGGSDLLLQLDTLDLSGNNFTGPMPAWFTHIDDLTLTGNHFRCPVLPGLTGQQCVNVPVVNEIDPACIETDEKDDVSIDVYGSFFIEIAELNCKLGNQTTKAKFKSTSRVSCELSEDLIKGTKDGQTLSLSVSNYGEDFSNATLITFKNKCKAQNTPTPSRSDSESDSESDSDSDSDKSRKGDKGGLSAWAVALIVICLVVGLVGIGGLAAAFYMKKKRYNSPYADTRHVALLQDTDNL